MSILYKKPEDLTYNIDFKQLGDGRLQISFSADCGKFGTEEPLDEYFLTVKQLLSILQKSELCDYCKSELSKQEVFCICKDCRDGMH